MYVHSCTSKAIDGHVDHCALNELIGKFGALPYVRITSIRLYFFSHSDVPCIWGKVSDNTQTSSFIVIGVEK